MKEAQHINRKHPNFICIGTQKAGTTSLHAILKEHPDIFLPDHKETHFFCRDEIYSNGYDWWWNEYFKDHKNETAMGEITPDYIYFEDSAERIHEHLGKDLKLVLILRNPVGRAYSQYLMEKKRGFENLEFDHAIEIEEKRIEKGFYEKNHFSYISRGHYSRQIRKMLEFFDAENILLLSFEKDIKADLKGSVARIQKHLGVEVVDLDIDIKTNVSQEIRNPGVHRIINSQNPIKKVFGKFFSPKMRWKIRKRIMHFNFKPLTSESRLSEERKKEIYDKYYASEVEELRKITGYDFSYWSNFDTKK